MPIWMNSNFAPPKDPALRARIDHVKQKGLADNAEKGQSKIEFSIE